MTIVISRTFDLVSGDVGRIARTFDLVSRTLGCGLAHIRCTRARMSAAASKQAVNIGSD